MPGCTKSKLIRKCIMAHNKRVNETDTHKITNNVYKTQMRKIFLVFLINIIFYFF